MNHGELLYGAHLRSSRPSSHSWQLILVILPPDVCDMMIFQYGQSNRNTLLSYMPQPLLPCSWLEG